LEAVRKELAQSEEVREIVEFIEKTERGIIR
jgi:acyl-[acyl carrier protein]--UDP-N-acetylglucosamine O-acyltransferase